MSMTDPIAAYLTRIRNALRAGHASVEVPKSNMNLAITGILKEEGYLEDFMVLDDRKQGLIHIDLKYRKNRPVIEKIQRISRPGRRSYSSAAELPRVLGGMGIAIVSTSRGVITDKQARRENVGGEVLCTVY
jgi:small subunit ribosomal protein S8